MGGPDPLSRLPYLAVSCVWSRLPLQDLLASRTVCKAWRQSLDTSHRWKGFLLEAGPSAEGDTPWERFLAERRADYNWRKGRFRRRQAPLLYREMACGGSEYLYFVSSTTVYFYNNKLEMVHKRDFGDEVSEISAAGTRLLVVTKLYPEFTIWLYDGLKEVTHVEECSGRFALSPDGRLAFLSRNHCQSPKCQNMTVGLFDGSGAIREWEAPKNVREIGFFQRSIVALSEVMHAYRVYFLDAEGPGVWVEVCSGPSCNPMALFTGSIYTNDNILAVVETCLDLSHYSYTILIKWKGEEEGKRVKLGEARFPFFQVAVGPHSIVYTSEEDAVTKEYVRKNQPITLSPRPRVKAIELRSRDQIFIFDKSVEYWTDKNKMYSLDIPFEIHGWVVQEKHIAFWSFKEILVMSLEEE